MNINFFDPKKEFWIEEGCHINELWNVPNDAHLSVALARLAPLHTTENHLLEKTTEKYVILEGIGEMNVNGEKNIVKKYDVINIPIGAPQFITNLSDTEDLIFLCICTPRFENQCYKSC